MMLMRPENYRNEKCMWLERPARRKYFSPEKSISLLNLAVFFVPEDQIYMLN